MDVMSTAKLQEKLDGYFEKMGERKWFDQTINKRISKASSNLSANAGCPYPKVTNPNLFKPAEEDPLRVINEKFRAVYGQTKKVTLKERIQGCVIVSSGDDLIFFNEGIRQQSGSITPQIYTDLKTIAHVAFSLYLILDPFSQERSEVFPTEQLEEFRELLLKVQATLNRRFKHTKYFGNDLLPNQELIVNKCFDFLEKVIKAQNVNRDELVHFCRDITPQIKQNIRQAAIAQTNELHSHVMEFKNSIKPEQWDDLQVVIMGSHMARKGHLVTQYFAKLLGIHEEDDRKLIFAEGIWDEEGVLDLLATSVTDTEASVAFFNDPTFMHSDVLAADTEEYLDELFHDAQSINVSMAQMFVLPGDVHGNHRRVRSAIKRAKEGGADLVCLPESAITGAFHFDEHLVDSIPGPSSDNIAAVAKEYKIFVCVGLKEKINAKIVNSVILIDDFGKIILHHREHQEPTVAICRFGKIGVFLMSEMKPGIEAMKKNKPDVILIPVGVVASPDHWPLKADHSVLHLCTHIAKEVGCPVIGSNGVGDYLWKQWTEDPEFAASVAVESNGNVLARTVSWKEHVKFVKVPFRKLSRSELARQSSQKWDVLKQLWNRVVEDSPLARKET